ncbi:MAG: hypothetical protein DRJ42_30170, partial [Deltaproteobacteria bacterium]
MTKRRRQVPGLGWAGAPFALLAACVGWALIINGCPSQVGSAPEGRETTAEREVDRFAVVTGNDESRPAAPSPADLLEQALAGIALGTDGSSDSSGSLGSRMQVREIRIPSPPRGATSRFNFDGGKRGWITALPSSQLLTTPAFFDGKVYLGGGFASHRFFAFDAYDGELAWTVSAPDGGPTAAIVYKHRVIFNTESCTIFVADVETGELLWKRWLGDPLMSQAAAADDLVMSAYPKNGGHEFGAFRIEDGEPVWTISIPADIIQAPQVSGNDVFFTTMDGTAHRVRVRDGHVLWARDVGASSAVWVDGDHVLLSVRVDRGGQPHEQPVVLDANSGRVSRRGEIARAPYLGGESRDRQFSQTQMGAWGSVPHGDHLGLNNIAAGWAFQGSSPAVADGRAYFAVAGEIRARDIATAEEVWTRSYGAADGAQSISPPAVVGSQIFFGTLEGHVYAADIDTGMIQWAYDVGEPVVFQPIVAQGWIYLATGEGNLIGLEIGDHLVDGWHMWGGNAQHAGLVEDAGDIDPHLLASLDRPGRGTMRVGRFEETEETATDATPAPVTATPEEHEEDEEAGDEAALPVDTDLPLVATRVEATVSGMVARVNVTQSFTNPHDRPIEAIYLFPLPADSAVDDMEMVIGDRIVRGQIKRRAQARQVYEEARSEGRRAALLEQQRPNLFAQRVANIGPGETIEVRLSYVQALPFEDGAYELVYPMVAPPRHDPSNPGSVIAPGGEVRQPSSVSLSLTIDAGLPLGRIESPTHDIAIERGGRQLATVRLEAARESQAQDFVLRYDVSGETPRATVMAHRAAGSEEDGHFSLVIQPPAAPAEETIAPREMVFVVDTSSSMAGRPLEHARAVMDHALGTVRAGDTFQVLAFSDRVVSLAPEPLAWSEDNLRRAKTFVEGIRATGSTNMVPAIEAALEGPLGRGHEDERLKLVVLLTDGFIGDEADVLRSIAENLGDARLYTFGIGSNTNRFLLERACEVGRGRTIVATLSEDPTEVATRFARLVDKPVFTDVEIDWGGLAVSDVYPRRLPDLFAGKPLVVHGRFEGGGSADVKIRGTVNGQRFERVIAVTFPEESADDRHAAHGTLWARAAVHERMNRIFLRDDPELIEEVTDLGLRYRMVTQYTSFVAVEERREEPEEGEEGEPEAQVRATVSPARALPGDPEIRIPAPRDARAVTIILPFGESMPAAFESDLGLWTARFLIPADAEDGSYPIEVLITHADGRQERMRVWYTVDASGAQLAVEVEGEVTPGNTVTLRARQVITERDLVQAGMRGDAVITEARAQFLSDARDVQLRTPAGEVID